MGSVFGGSSSKSVQPVGQQTTIQKSEPWEGQKGYLSDVYARGQALAATPQQYYPGSTVVPFSGQTENALSSIENRARTGSPIQDAGQAEYLKTIQGGYLNNNPYLDAQYNRAVRPITENYLKAVAPGIMGDASTGGRYGSGLYRSLQGTAQDNLGRTLGEFGTDIYGKAYESERGRQNEAIKGAPDYAMKDYQDAQALLGVGNQREALAGRQLQDLVNRWNFSQESPWSTLGNYNSLVQGDYGRTQQTTQPIFGSEQPNLLQQLGGAGGGLGLLGMGLKGFL